MSTHRELTQGETSVSPGPPSWFNSHGMKMETQKPGPFNGGQCDLIIGNGVVAFVRISRVDKRPKYLVDWRVIHSGGLDTPYTGGRIEIDRTELVQMFRISDEHTEDTDQWLIERYGGTVATQGKFLRSGKYLNIPCPGTGHDGDPNISVFVTDEIRNAVTFMLARQDRPQQ